MNKKLKIIKIIFIFLILSSCAKTRTEKQLLITDTNIKIIQKNTKETKEIINKSKKIIKNIKTNIPECKIHIVNIEQQLEIIELYTIGNDKNLILLKQQNQLIKESIKLDVKEYKNKYLFLKWLIIISGIFITVIYLKKI